MLQYFEFHTACRSFHMVLQKTDIVHKIPLTILQEEYGTHERLGCFVSLGINHQMICICGGQRYLLSCNNGAGICFLALQCPHSTFENSRVHRVHVGLDVFPTFKPFQVNQERSIFSHFQRLFSTLGGGDLRALYRIVKASLAVYRRGRPFSKNGIRRSFRQHSWVC